MLSPETRPINCACANDEPAVIKVPGWYRNVRRQDETPVKLPGSPRSSAHEHESSGEDGENGNRQIREHNADMNVDVICTFNSRKEGFNGVSSIKTDIYYRLGWLWFAATSKWTRDYGRTRSTFQNKAQVSLSVLSPHGSTEPRFRFIKRWIGPERPQTLQELLRMSKITNHGRPLWSQGTRLMT